MALLNTKFTRADLRGIIRREIMDTGTRWWTDTELNGYIDDWQTSIQDDMELVWGTALATSIASNLTLDTLGGGILRVDAVYWNDKRLVPRTKEELDIINQDWRNALPGTPIVCYQDDSQSFSFYPAPDVIGTVLIHFPRILSFVTDTSTMEIPAWAKYSIKNYGTHRAYLRAGPNQDINKSLKRLKKFKTTVNQYKDLYGNYFPDRYPSLRPGSKYEAAILSPTNITRIP